MTIKKKRKLTEQERKAYAIVGSYGGKATFRKRGKAYMSKIGKKGAEKRWANNKKNK